MLGIGVFFELWQQSLDCNFDVADQSVVEFRATPELFSANIYLDNGRVLRKELLIREVRPDHQQRVAVHHRKVTGRKSEQAGHADIKRVVVLDEFLSAQRVDDWRLQFPCERDQLGMGAGATGAGENS